MMKESIGSSSLNFDEKKVTEWIVVDIPVISYEEAWELQKNIVQAIHEGKIDRDVVLLLEHHPVFTVGRRGGKDNLKVSEDFLKENKIPVIQVERGGNITYHGPGQLVGYPIVRLGKNSLTIPEFTCHIEEVMIRSAGEMNVFSERNPKNPGIWVKNGKLGSIGIAVRRGISFHGFAFNINLSLSPFEWIHPCGFSDIHMTSIEKEGNGEITVDSARLVVKKHMEDVFSVKLRPLTIDALIKP